MTKQKNVLVETDRIILSTSSIDECIDLQNICDSWDDKVLIEGDKFEADYIYQCLTKGDFPPIPEASMSSYRLMSIYIKQTDELIGFTDLYFGYPTNETAWISIFMIHKSHRKNGYAREAIELVSLYCKQKGYDKIGIGVYLKNWRALRFWTKAGFDRVTDIKGDKDYGVNAFARIGLEKYIA